MKTRALKILASTKWLPLLLLLALPAVAQTQVNYAVSGNTAYVTNSPNAAGNIVIASTYGNHPVTSISDYAFEYCSGLTSVTTPGNTSIGVGAFFYCSGLTNVTIGNYGDSVNSIGNYAFEYCFSLTSVTIPGEVFSIGAKAFADCPRLTRVTLGDVFGMGLGPFLDCYDLTNIAVVNAVNGYFASVGGVLFNKKLTTLIEYPAGLAGSYVIPNSVTSIGSEAFLDCSRLTSVTIPNSVTSIGIEAFSDCSRLTSVTIPDSVTSIGYGAFEYCSGLTNVTIGNSVTSIGSDAFLNCFGLTNVTIPGSVTSIGNYAFSDCSGLKSVTIPNSVTSIGSYAFEHSSGLHQAFFQGNAPSVNGGVGSTDSTVFQSTGAGTAYYLPGTTGWGATFGGWPTAQWYQPQPQILGSGYGLGVQSNRFQFTISWATNISVVVEAATNLANPVWVPVSTNALVNGTNFFSDPQWTDYPGRYYRVRSQ